MFFEGEQLELTGVKTPHDTWWGQVIDHFDGQFLANASWSGCVVEGRDFPVGASAERIEHLQADGRTPDDILVHIGINDYGWGSGYAQICAATPSAPPKLAAECPDHGKVAGMAPKEPFPTSRNPTAACWQRCTPNTRTPASGSPRSFPGA